MAHTPGPWHVGASGITVFAREGTNKVAAPGTDVPIEEKQNNAALIAAAPDLLAALELAIPILHDRAAGGRMLTGRDNAEDVFTTARAALAKAKG